ncbi:MAG: redoxin domain-containing protein [Bacteroidales bacterium]|nr:redoxin domain-containing protein [Bacteroidales bacterium]
MKSYKILTAAALVLALSACQGNKAKLDCTVSDTPEASLVLKQLNGTATEVLDTVKTDASGHFAYKLEVKEGNPEFVYVYNGDTRLASLLLEKGETAVVKADALGNYEVSGSEGSVLLKQGDDSFRDFAGKLISMSESGASQGAINKVYVDHYRQSVKFVLTNCKSLAVIPVLYENIGGSAATFSGVNDALIFRSVCDSLKTVYPDSKYVRALEQETARREQLFNLNNRLKAADPRSYPELKMPSVDGTVANLDSLGAKYTLLYFWNDSEYTHKIFNLETLKPVYEQYHSRGLEIYAISVNADKSAWAQVVKSQELPWVNVNDGLGLSSASLTLYNVQRVPTILLVSEKGIDQIPVRDKAVRNAVAKALK